MANERKPEEMEKASFTGGRELVVVVKPEAGLRVEREMLKSATAVDVSPLSEFLKSEGVTMQPLFGLSEKRLGEQTASLAAATGTTEINLSIYYRIDAPDERLDQLAESLRQLEVVDGAYVKPPAMPANLMPMQVVPAEEEPPALTPDFTSRQGYLDAAPGGIDARYAWTQPGGRGAGVKIIDIEGGWRFSHEDLVQNQGGMVGSGVSGDEGWVNHGTAVVGVIGGDVNTFGITGICPDANVRGISIYDTPTKQNSPRALREAADRLGAGDIILIELQRDYRAVEWWPDEFDAIRYAVNKGIIVVEAAGNGNHNLDDSNYNTPAPGFPSTWKNPYNSANPSSGAVMVGAGNPPAGTHGRNRNEAPYPDPSWEPYVDRARCWFSCYGSRVDVQGWGWEVTSTGYGDFQGGSDKNLHYTDYFRGTSSASPVVVGALGCLQGILRAKEKPLLTPEKARELLRATGSPQQDGPGFTFPNGTVFPARPSTQRIGNRPDLKALIAQATTLSASFEVVTYQYYNWSSRKTGKTNLILKGVGGETCSVWFVEDETANLPAAKQVAVNYFAFYYHHSQLPHLIDMLRNEKPIFVFFQNNGNNSRISTTHEPVGEGEET